MPKLTVALLLGSSLLAGCSVMERLRPPSAVEVDRAVPVACRVAEPECRAPAFNAATKGQEGDVKLRLLRAEGVEREDCLRRYREALAACRSPVEAPKP